ncbi:nuclear transport factor 2 family protein [Tuwongella immobilis]|uniref:DUF4440 domain-containing protein n=1 Tax=Tuwongella immobilis TaxID=692036 RepID=A0A6C2YPV7_9BACT|nr:nuclear transport factor 2 family protein [Tuwongella immobilis]VIP03424.1 Uncharacterized protein OS=Planctomyces maris DSM 8797 GN=PM8797T_19759 PE=4 SV=1: DUF4440 [Tuwongella immobilis]VTS04220.1 Uncharacterized protein OS=Planctomyces maris DSM 8797 GN=PM8797T_19759 PE=4 SV=1: DUF4440 [Tuwongella immobilis]
MREFRCLLALASLSWGLVPVAIAQAPASAERPPASAASQVQSALDALNAAFERGDVKAVAARMTPEHLAITSYYPKPLPREEQIRSLADHQLSQYRTSELSLQPLSPDSMLVTFRVTMKGTYRGKPVPETSFASAIWVRRQGQWLEHFYQETPIPAK